MIFDKNMYIKDVVPVVLGGWFNAYGLVLSFAREKVHPVLLTHRAMDFCMNSKYLAYSQVISDANNEDKFIDDLCSFGQKLFPYKGILYPTNDEQILAIAKHEELIRKYYEIPFSDYNTCISILNKDNFAKECSRIHIPIIPGEIVSCVEDALRFSRNHAYPIMIKLVMWEANSVVALGGKNRIAYSSTEFKRYMKEFFSNGKAHQVLLQEYIEDSNIPMPTVKSFGDREGNLQFIYIAEKIRQFPPKRGGSTAMITVDPERKKYLKLIEYTARIAKHFNFYGLFGIEYKWDVRIDDYRVVEMNIRSEQLNYLPTLCGQNAAYQLYRYHLCNKTSIPFYPPIKTGMSLLPFWDAYDSIIVNKRRYPDYAISWKEWKESQVQPLTYYGLTLEDLSPCCRFYASVVKNLAVILLRRLLGAPEDMRLKQYLVRLLRGQKK